MVLAGTFTFVTVITTFLSIFYYKSTHPYNNTRSNYLRTQVISAAPATVAATLEKNKNKKDAATETKAEATSGNNAGERYGAAIGVAAPGVASGNNAGERYGAYAGEAPGNNRTAPDAAISRQHTVLGVPVYQSSERNPIFQTNSFNKENNKEHSLIQFLKRVFNKYNSSYIRDNTAIRGGGKEDKNNHVFMIAYAYIIKMWRAAIYYKYLKEQNKYRLFVYDMVSSFFLILGISLLCSNSIYIFFLLFVDAMLGASGAMLVKDVYNTKILHIVPILVPFYFVGL
jgi:hypothetical protein